MHYYYYIPLILYSILIIAFVVGWYRLKPIKASTKIPETKVSIIVACRNEAENISKLIDSLANQNYPQELTEIIFIDDHSEDNTYNVIADSCKTHKNILVQKLPQEEFGKKSAIAKGIEIARGKLILSTDADCSMHKKWASTIVNYYEITKAKLLLAPVVLHPNKSIFDKFQALEFISLTASTAGSSGISNPIMCNGANLAYEKDYYLELQNEGNKFSSGDDMFLLTLLKKQKHSKIQFIKSRDAIVYTKAQKSLKDFFNQRIRWTSKSKAYSDPIIILSALLVAFVNIGWLAAFIFAFLNPAYWEIVIVYYIVKSIVDLTLLIPVSTFLKKAWLLILFPLLQIIYPFYIVFTATLGSVCKFEWKGRKLSK